jgi:DNA-binding MarR family transcriptional regulator
MPRPSRAERLSGLFLALKRALHERLQGSGALKAAPMPRLAVLEMLHGRADATMKDVAAFLCVTPPTATFIVEGMAESGLLTRRQDAADRRSVRLRLTPKGERLHAAGMRKIEASMRRMFSKLDTAEQERLIALLEKLLV